MSKNLNELDRKNKADAAEPNEKKRAIKKLKQANKLMDRMLQSLSKYPDRRNNENK
jgi:hypothetical protein